MKKFKINYLPMKTKGVVFLVFVLFAIITLVPIRYSYADLVPQCTKYSATPDFSACIFRVKEKMKDRLDKKLKIISPKVHRQLHQIGADEMLLENSQADWEKYVETQCELEGRLGGHALWAGIMTGECAIESIRERQNFLTTLPMGS